MRRIKVLLFTDMRWITGGNKRTWEIMKRAKSFGIDYVSIIDKSSLEWFKKRNVPIPNFDYVLDFAGWASKSKFKYLFTYFRAGTEIAKIALKERIDLIYSPSEFPNLERIARIASFISGIPWTVLLQEIPVIGMPRNANLLTLIKLRLYFLLADHITLVTSSIMVYRYVKSMIPPIRLERIEPGIGIDSEKIRLATPFPGHFDAVYYARLSPEKGANEVLKIWKKVVNSKPDARLAVCGIATDEAEIVFKNEIVKENLVDNVLYFGFQKDERLFGIVKSSTMALYPSHWDGFSMVVLEVLACGRPVVAYSIDAIKLSYSNCKAVIQVREGDTESMFREVLNIIENPGISQTLSDSALRFAERFDWDRVVEAEKDAYFRVVKHDDDILTKEVERNQALS